MIVGHPVRPIGLSRQRSGIAVATAALTLLAASPAHAADGCLVLLCFAAPSWSAIPQCVAPIRQVLRDLARGRAFPTCGMAGVGNGATHAWASAPGNCPPQYTWEMGAEGTPMMGCDFSGAVTVRINGASFSRTWWNMAGTTVTEFSSAAKATLGRWDTRFEADYVAKFGALPPDFGF